MRVPRIIHAPLHPRHLRIASLILVSAVTISHLPSAARATDEQPPRPWSGYVTTKQAWTNQEQVNLTHAWTSTRYADGQTDGYTYVDDPHWTCSGSETVRLAPSGDGQVFEDYSYSLQPFTADVSYEEACSGYYWVLRSGSDEGERCEVAIRGYSTASATASISETGGLEVAYSDGLWGFRGDASSLNETTIGYSLTDPCGWVTVYPLVAAMEAGNGPRGVSGPPFGSIQVGTRLSGTYSQSWAGFDWTFAWDLVYQGAPPTTEPDTNCFPNLTATAGDADGDRLPDSYETGTLGTDPSDPDTDADCYLDTREVIRGSSPLDASETPENLPGGIAPTSLIARGDTGITCGATRFKWVSPALKSLGVENRQQGCIMLFSNRTANAVVDYSLEYGPSMTATLLKVLGPYLKEVYGYEAVKWAREARFDAAIWGAKIGAKQALLKALNLTRINGVFVAGEVAGLAGVAVGTLWALKQVRDKNACIQVRIGTRADGGSTLSWSLVYSAENLTSEGLASGLHNAGVWKKKVLDNAPDRAVRKSINLRCDQGSVVATGGSAGAVFASPTSYIF